MTYVLPPEIEEELTSLVVDYGEAVLDGVLGVDDSEEFLESVLFYGAAMMAEAWENGYKTNTAPAENPYRSAEANAIHKAVKNR